MIATAFWYSISEGIVFMQVLWLLSDG